VFTKFGLSLPCVSEDLIKKDTVTTALSEASSSEEEGQEVARDPKMEDIRNRLKACEDRLVQTSQEQTLQKQVFLHRLITILFACSRKKNCYKVSSLVKIFETSQRCEDDTCEPAV